MIQSVSKRKKGKVMNQLAMGKIPLAHNTTRQYPMKH